MNPLAQDFLLAASPSAFAIRHGFKPDEWQVQYMDSQRRRIILCIHRQGGKTGATAWKVLHRAAFRPRSLILMTASAGRQSAEAFGRVKEIIEEIKHPYEYVEEAFPDDLPELKEDKKLSLVFENGSRIVALPCKASSVRSFSSVGCLVIDEAAFVPKDFFVAVSPMLGISKGQMLVMSTPRGKRGQFFDLWSKENGYEKYRRTADQCPRLGPEFLAQEREDMGEWMYRQEYMCEFVEGEGQFFGHDLVMSAFTDQVKPLFGEPSATEKSPTITPEVSPLFGVNR